MISGTETKMLVPITYGKKRFPEKELQNDDTIINPGSKYD
jgi:hypothetical protein